MRRFMYNPDAGSIVLNAGFTIASMGLSAYCGWLLAEGTNNPIIQIVSALLFSMVAAALAVWTVRRERYKLSRDRTSYLGAQRVVWFLLIANFATDFSASAALRAQTNVGAENKNTIARNARKEVTRIEAALADKKAEKAWRTKYNAPESYEALINQQKQITERGRNIWKRSEQCTNTTVPSSQKVCTRIDELKATKANAERRQIVLKEIEALSAELVQAKKDVGENKMASNAALAPIIQLVNMLTLSLDSGKNEIQWGQNFFVLFFTCVISAAIYFSSADLGRRLGPMPEPAPMPDAPPNEPDNYWIEDKRPAPQREPIPLRAENVSRETTVTASSADPDAWKQSMAALDKILARVEAKRSAM